MKRYSRNFIKSNIVCLSNSGQLLFRKEILTSDSVKFWKFFPESYFVKRQTKSTVRSPRKTIYSFKNW